MYKLKTINQSRDVYSNKNINKMKNLECNLIYEGDIFLRQYWY